MTTSSPAPQHLLMDPAFRVGLARLGRFGLSYECSLYHPQLPELIDLARAFPDLPILANHCGGPICVGPVSRATGRDIRCLAAGPARAGDVPQRASEAWRPGDDDPRLRFHEELLPPSSGELAAAWRPFMETCIEAFGAERCMFESNFPVDKGMCSYPVVWNAFKRLAAGCSDAEKAALFHGTAARFYRLGDIA